MMCCQVIDDNNYNIIIIEHQTVDYYQVVFQNNNYNRKSILLQSNFRVTDYITNFHMQNTKYYPNSVTIVTYTCN